MDKDEILAKSRAENLGNDEYERVVLEKAGRAAAQIGMLACCAVALVSVATSGRTNVSCWVIYFAIQGTTFWVKYHYLRRRHELIMAVTSTIAGLFLLSLFVMEIMERIHG